VLLNSTVYFYCILFVLSVYCLCRINVIIIVLRHPVYRSRTNVDRILKCDWEIRWQPTLSTCIRLPLFFGWLICRVHSKPAVRSAVGKVSWLQLMWQQPQRRRRRAYARDSIRCEYWLTAEVTTTVFASPSASPLPPPETVHVAVHQFHIF